MKMKKRIIMLFLSCVILFSMAACGRADETVESEIDTVIEETEEETQTEVYEETNEEESFDENDISWGNDSPADAETSVPEAPSQNTEECLGDDALTW